MAVNFQMTQIGKHKIKLTNLDKVLFPESGVIKAELVAYYLKIAPTLLRYIRRRALSLIRFPDGIQAHQFFQKDKPDWAPNWIESVPLGKEEKKDYIMATDEASIVWLANMASIELHIRQDRNPNHDKPDFFIFDLDPPEGQPIREVVEIAQQLHEFLVPFGYHPFVKTSGGKGLHIFVPIETKYDYDTMFACVKSLAEEFISLHQGSCTLKINKEARKGKLLVDIYRNHASQTIVAPYSVRGREPAPVSMPLAWQQLHDLDDPTVYHVRNVADIVKREGDQWEGFQSYSVPLHTDSDERKGSTIVLPPSKFYKTPDQLKSYLEKRDFSKTPEPPPSLVETDGDAFVVHRHHASRLHYDLRLEKDGTLLSWAVPKGMPHKPGIKRLAVQTEPHPVEYLQFDGEIPKDQYGGGMMWIYARGKYEITKEKKDGFYFHLSSPQMDGEYRMHNTKSKEWLLERVDRDLINILEDKVPVMLADSADKLPANKDDYFYEVKWDGIRAIIAIEEGVMKIRSRNQNDLTDRFPELTNLAESFRISNGIFDGEIVCLDAKGRPDFKKVIARMHSSNKVKIEKSTRSNPVYCYLFDCIYLDGRSLLGEPIERRRMWCSDSIKKGSSYRMSEAIDDGEALWEAAGKLQLEGIIAKKRGSKYQMGKRTTDWIKIKYRQSEEVAIIGYTEGGGDRVNTFGALHIAEKIDNRLIYRGKVGTGFDGQKMKEIIEVLHKVEVIEKPIEEKIPDEKVTTWIKPEVTCEVKFASITDNGTYREPIFQFLVDY
jgi:DNA ligase D-like protein (predicted polymerase)/DNA ligase D-like protein (predicted ligase)/DNA ligase D-like protein (predicted 3'-phosphoesterase)